MQNNYHIFWGGEDVHPSFYNRASSNRLGITNMARDEEEIALAKQLIKDSIPCIGICRGAQLLNVVNGGVLVQHLINHPFGAHNLQTHDSGTIMSNSTHHQMMIPKGNYQLLAWEQEERRCLDPDSDQETTIPRVNEVIWFPDTQCLCIQPHPEWLPQESQFVQWINKQVKHLLNLEIDWKKEHYGIEY